MIRRRLRVHGVVQGVGFRWSCARVAEEHAVAGWVRNLPDGSVEMVVEGSVDDVEAMVAWAQHGPRGSSVTRVDVVEEPVGDQAGFEVRS